MTMSRSRCVKETHTEGAQAAARAILSGVLGTGRRDHGCPRGVPDAMGDGRGSDAADGGLALALSGGGHRCEWQRERREGGGTREATRCG